MLFTSLFCCRSNSHTPDDPAEPSSSARKQDSEPPAPVRQRVLSSKKSTLTLSVKKTEPYNAADVQSLFKAYADEDDADIISPENFERLCTDANVPMEGPMPLILLWHMDAQDLGTIKKDQWTKAMQDSQCVVHTLRVSPFLTAPKDFVTGHTSNLLGRYGRVASHD
jgi:DCN1-like protein 4/5